MITRVEIDGHTTFADVALDLEPFTIIAGANDAGRSNLVEALLLHRLADGGDLPAQRVSDGTLRAPS